MTDEPAELTSWSLASVKASGMELEGGCKTPGCNEFARFDVDGLIERFGADWLVPKVLPVRCQACGEWLHFQLAVLHDEPNE